MKAVSDRLKKSLFYVGVFCFVVSDTLANPMMLVSPEEYRREQSGPPQYARAFTYQGASPSGAPRIDLVYPEIDKPVSVPTRVDVRFFSQPPAELDPSSFRVRYGRMQMDITERLLSIATLTKEGLVAKGLALPVGEHQLSISITDTLGRQTVHTLNFSVR